MKSRLAVSLVFILIGVAFTSHATGAFKKFRSCTHKVRGRYTEQVRNRLSSRDSAWKGAIKSNDKAESTMIHVYGDSLPLKKNCPTVSQPRMVGTISPEGKNIDFNSAEPSKDVSSQEGHTQGTVFKLVGSEYHSEALDFITTAARQIHEVLGLIRIK